MKNGKLRVALVGVSFGAEFIPIYLKHPDVDSLVLVDTNEKLLNTVGDKFLLEERLTDFNAMLEDKTIDAVHLVTPPATHAPLSIQVMNAGKHCACTIPMGMSIAKSKEQNNRPLVESSLKTIFFFCLSSGFTQGGAVVSRKQNSQPKAIFFADIDAGNGPFISRKKKRKCRSCTKRKSKNQISDSADGF